MITAKGWDSAGHFADVGKSGWDHNATRPEFEEMTAAVHAGHVDAVIVFSLSRLTRQGALEARLINEELARHDVRLVSVEEPYLDTSGPPCVVEIPRCATDTHGAPRSAHAGGGAPRDAVGMAEYGWQRVAREIEQEIPSGRIPPGGALLGIVRMAERYGVADRPVRRALRDPRERGLVETLPSKGTFVFDAGNDKSPA